MSGEQERQVVTFEPRGANVTLLTCRETEVAAAAGQAPVRRWPRAGSST